MAREYNRKYSVNSNHVSMLTSNDEFLVSGINEVFCKIFKLFAEIRNTFKRYNQFSKLFERVDYFQETLKDFYKHNFNCDLKCDYEINNKPINHKHCAISMMVSYIDIFNLNMDILSEIDKLKNCLMLNRENNSLENNNLKHRLEILLSKLYELQDIFKKFTEILKDFYKTIN